VKKAREQILAIVQNLDVSAEELLDNTAKKYKTDKTEKVRPQYKNQPTVAKLGLDGTPAEVDCGWTSKRKKTGRFSDQII
jgi:hypothetical protein